MDYETLQTLLNKNKIQENIPYRSVGCEPAKYFLVAPNKSSLQNFYSKLNQEKVCLNCGVVGHYE